ncbi:MAG: tRNA1(Val) (adenine(37)-N6)-methyltransferase [Bacilli bacterium]
MEVLHSLVGYKDRVIYQNTEWFTFSLDSVLLARFVTINKRISKILDLGTGNAPIPLILSTRTDKPIVGIELQPDVCELARKSVAKNHLESQINIDCINIKDICSTYSAETFDIITMNPPYFKVKQNAIINEDIHKTIARHEVEITLEQIISTVRFLLKTNGVFAMVHRTDRFIEVIDLLHKYKLEPKRIQFIFPKEKESSNMFLIEVTKNGKTGLTLLPPLYIHNNDGSYREEIEKIFVD